MDIIPHDAADLLIRVQYLVLLVLSLTVHEFAHAWSAWLLGDDTAARQGRLTLNPKAHIDLIGTVLLPLLKVPFGWAKPVPVNPLRFTRKVSMSLGMLITAIAGPLSNLLLAMLGAVVLGIFMRFSPAFVGANPVVWDLLGRIVVLNVALALFNMIPIPPLDGSRVVDHFVPLRLRDSWQQFGSVAPFVLLGVMVFGGRLIAGPTSAVAGFMFRLAMPS